MNLHVTYGKSVARRYVTYDITPNVDPSLVIGCQTKDEFDHLVTLTPRIEKMARELLGDAFLSLTPLEDYGLIMKVAVGTSGSAKKYEFAELRGWIALFDVEWEASRIS